MRATDSSHWLASESPPVESGGDRPLHLRGDRVWWVQAGRIDVFSVRLVDDEVVSGRTHLFRVGEGGLVLGTGAAAAAAAKGLGLIGVGGVGTRVVELDRARLLERSRLPEFRDTVAALLEQWVETLCEGLARGAVPVDSVALGAEEEHVVSAAGPVRPAERIGWITHVEGHSLLMGRPGLKVNGLGYTPIGGRAWLQTEAGSRLRVQTTAALLRDGSLWTGLDQLHALLLQAAAQEAERATIAAAERLLAKARTSGAALRGAFATLADTLNASARTLAVAGDGAAPFLPDDIDPFHAACQRVGAAMRIPIRPLPRSADAAQPRDPLAALARANRFRWRHVVLRDGWWRQEGGPLLGTLQDGGRPVALLPARGGRYTLFDPTLSVGEPVDAGNADRVAPVATALYRPFPDEPVGISDILRFGLGGCSRDLLTVLAMGGAGGLLSLAPPIATGMIFNAIIPGAARSQLVQLTAILLVIAVAGSLFTVTSGIALTRLETRMGSAVQAAVWDRLLSLPVPFFRPYSAGNLTQRANGIDAIRQVLSGATISALLGGLFSVCHLGLLFYYAPSLAGWSALLIALAIAVTVVGGKVQMRWDRLVTAGRNRLAGTVLQFLGSIAKLRVSAAEPQAFVLWARQFGRQRQLQFRARSVGNALAAFQATFPLVAMLALYALALPLLNAGTAPLPVGNFLAFVSSFGICLSGTLAACSALVSASAVVPLYEQAKPILQARPEVDLARTDPGVLSGHLEVQHLSFRYSPDGPLVLRDVNLRIRAGEYVAFVGASGSGKSTLLRLLLGFETPESGVIYYDGQDLAGLDSQAVRRQIGVVLQNGRFMTGDMYTNIVGSSNATLEEAWDAARMAGLDQDIQQMPMGMHTLVTEGATTLSGGQRQRLMIARAIVQKPRVLYFDEATSALDNRTQAIVGASLERLQATRVVIAHRLSTILNADQIYVVQGGRIVQHGTYRELMGQEGLFLELARRQLA